MNMSSESLLVILFVGLVAGWLAGQIVRGTGFGIVGDLIIGILGAFIGSWLLPQLGIHLGSGIISAIVNATIGAVLLLFVVRLLRGGGGWGSRWRGRWGWTHAASRQQLVGVRENHEPNLGPDRFQMKDFSNASFPPETIGDHESCVG